MKIAAGSDAAGLALKRHLLAHLAARGVEVEDVGTYTDASCDYPDFALAVARKVGAGEVAFGLLCCGTGQGMAMTANKVAGVRAAVCGDTFSAHATREHNDANVLCLGERVTGAHLAADILDAFLGARFEGGRHERRVNKIKALDETKG